MIEPKVITSLNNETGLTRRAPDYKVYYSNQSRMRLSPSEVQVFFGMQTDEPGIESFFNSELMSVILPPQHAKMLARSLTTAIEAHELQFGEIKLPENIEKFMESIRAQVMEFAKQQATLQGAKPAK